MHTIRGPVALLRGAWGIFTEKPQLFLSIYLIPTIIIFGTSFIVGTAANDPREAFVENPVLVILSAAVVLIVSVLMGIAMMKAVSDPKHLTLKDTFVFSTKYFFPYLFVSVLVFLAVIGGLLLFIIPGIIVMVWFAFSYFVLLFEDKRGTKALSASRAYVKGKWFAVFGRYLFFIALVIVVTMVVAAITAVIEGVSTEMIASVFPLLVDAILVPLSIAYTYLLYRDVSAASSIEEGGTVPTVPSPQSLSEETKAGNTTIPTNGQGSETNEPRSI